MYIAIGRVSRAMVHSDARALALVSVSAGALGVLAIAGLFRRLRPDDRGAWLAATAVAVTAPLYWLTAVRPLSDTAGLAAAIGVQTMTLGSRTRRGLLLAAIVAGLAAGIRSQVLWLTAPLLFVTGLTPSGVRPVTNGLAVVAAGLAGGVAAWFVPLVAMTGGPGAYWTAVSSQGAEDLSGIRMLWTTPTIRELADALYYAFVAPWAIWPLASVVLGFAVAGILTLARNDRRTLTLIAIGFGPYLVFDVVFQETFTSRYALPLVVPVAFLAASGMRILPAQPALLVAAALSMFGAHLGGRSAAAYSRHAAPAFQMLDEMRTATASSPAAPVLAPDRRQSLDLRRPLVWLGDRAPRFERQLAAPPQREWLEAVNYWNGGGGAPVWFVVDPRRAAMALIQHGDPLRYRWTLPYPVLMSGTRPGDVDLYKVDHPDWYVGTGWALTPEAAGISAHDGSDGPLSAWVASRLLPGQLLVGGRNFDAAAHELSVDAPSMGHATLARFSVPPGFFVQAVRLPPFQPAPETGFLALEIDRPRGARVAIEQFDASGGSRPRSMLAYGDGFFEHEYDPSTGRQWRWLGSRGELIYVAAGGGVLEIDGESPRRYYAAESRLTIRSGGAILKEVRAGDDFTIRVDLPPSIDPARVIVETDQTHVPADAGWRHSQDRRRLGLRVFRCELRPQT